MRVHCSQVLCVLLGVKARFVQGLLPSPQHGLLKQGLPPECQQGLFKQSNKFQCPALKPLKERTLLDTTRKVTVQNPATMTEYKATLEARMSPRSPPSPPSSGSCSDETLRVQDFRVRRGPRQPTLSKSERAWTTLTQLIQQQRLQGIAGLSRARARLNDLKSFLPPVSRALFAHSVATKACSSCASAHRKGSGEKLLGIRPAAL